MKILVDPEIFFYGRCGMVRYYSRLLQEIAKRGTIIDLPLYLSGSDMIRGQKEHLRKWVEILPYGKKRVQKFLQRKSKKEYYKKIKEGKYDLLFLTSPILEDRFLDFLPERKPFITVVHDTMQCVLGPDSFYDPAGNNGDKLAFLARRASQVVCISQKVSADVMNLSGIPEDRITVIHTGNLLDLATEEIPQEEVPPNYILFVGERSGRKNFRSFIRAISPLLNNNKELNVVCTGQPSRWEQDLFKNLGIDKQMFFIQATDAVLVHLYKNAKCLAYPSLYEGFGLPILEAMSLGCPVFTSREGALNEVGGDAVYYINPTDRGSMLRGIEKLSLNEDLREDLKSRGLERAKRFEVEVMVSQFISTFERITLHSENPSPLTLTHYN